MSTIKYPDPITGAWKILGGTPPDAPSDSKTYGRKNGAWSEVVSGILEAPVDGKQYARKDAAWTEVSGGGGTNSGEWTFNGTLTPPPSNGQLRVNNASQPAATLLYLSGITAPGIDTANGLRGILPTTHRIYFQDKNDSSKYITYSVTGPFIDHTTWFEIPVAVINNGAAVPEQRIEVTFLGASTTEYVKKSGDTMTGPLVLPNDPAQPLQASTKQYVDAKVAAVPPFPEAPVDGKIYGRKNAAWIEVPAGGGGASVGENLIHNPLMNVQQRGAGAWTTTNAYTADRWKISLITDAVSFSIVAFTAAERTEIGDESPTSWLQNVFTGNAGASAYNAITQPIEGVRRLANKTVTISFYAKASAGTPKLGVSFDQNFGTGGGPSATVQGTGQSVTLSTTSTRYSLTFAIPSISAKTVGTGRDDLTLLFFWFSSGTTNANRSGSVGVQSGTVKVSGVKLEIGSSATTFEYPDPVEDLVNCQRFYEIGRVYMRGFAASGTSTFATPIRFNTPKQRTTTITFPSPSYVNASNIIASDQSQTGFGGFTVLANVTAASSDTNVNSDWTASAEL